MRRLILVMAMMGVAVLLASGAALAITYGWDDDGDCQDEEPTPCDRGIIKYPGVGALVDEEEGGAYCSGTLVPGKDLADGTPGPPVFLTADHCLPWEGNTSYVTFDPNYTQGSSPEYKGRFIDNPHWYLRGNDIAVVVFDNPQELLEDPFLSPGTEPLPLAQLPAQGSLSNLEKGRKFTAVGYGVTSGTSDDTGVRRYAFSKLTSTNSYYLGLSQHQKQGNGGTCNGDSGGPNFLWTKASSTAPATETNINAALTNTGDAMCKSKNTVLRLDTQAARDFLGDYVALP